MTPARNKLSLADIVTMAAGVVMLIGSFLAFYTQPGYTVSGFVVASVSASAWSSGLFGIATVVVVCGVAMAGQVALANYGSVNLSPRPFGLRWDQIQLVLGFQAAIMMVAFLLQDRGGINLGIGFWLMFISAIALFISAITRARRRPNLREL